MSYRAASVDSITDYNGFSPHRSSEVDRVYLTFLSVGSCGLMVRESDS